jgi:hypothetical protein
MVFVAPTGPTPTARLSRTPYPSRPDRQHNSLGHRFIRGTDGFVEITLECAQWDQAV